MKNLFALAISVCQLLSPAAAAQTSCADVQRQIESKDENKFIRGLQAMLTLNCTELYPKVAEMLTSPTALLPRRSMDALALTGDRSYGPLLVKEYYRASLYPGDSILPFDLREAVILACTDLPRGTEIQRIESYRHRAHPTLDDSCVNMYRTLISGSSDEYVRKSAMALLQETSTPSAIDLIEETLEKGGRYPRREAVLALQYLSFDVSEAAFRRALNDPDAEVRYQAVRLLSKRPETGVETLFKERIPVETDGQLRDMMKGRLASSDEREE